MMSEQSKAAGGEVTKIPTKEEREMDQRFIASALRQPTEAMQILCKYIAALEHVEAERDAVIKNYKELQLCSESHQRYGRGAEAHVEKLKAERDALREENARLLAQLEKERQTRISYGFSE